MFKMTYPFWELSDFVAILISKEEYSSVAEDFLVKRNSIHYWYSDYTRTTIYSEL